MKKLLLSVVLSGLFVLGLMAQTPVTYFDFEGPVDTNPVLTSGGYSWIIGANPHKVAPNVSDSVCVVTKSKNSWDYVKFEFPNTVDLSNDTIFSMLVYSADSTGFARLQLEGPGMSTQKLSQEYTTAGDWALMEWHIPKSFDDQINVVKFLFDDKDKDPGEVWYFDEFKAPATNRVPAPRSYYSTVNNRPETTGFSGAFLEGIVPNPVVSDIMDHPYAAKTITGTANWAGFAWNIPTSVDFSESQTFEMYVLSDSIGNARVQLEGSGATTMKISVPYTTPGEWQLLIFDAANATAGSTSDVYDKIVLIFDDADSDAGEVWYFDELRGPKTVPATGDPTYTYFDFDNKVTEEEWFGWSNTLWGGIVTNPLKTGNTSDSVGVSYTGKDTWGGIAYDLPSTVSFAEGDVFSMMVYHADSTGNARVQLEGPGKKLKISVPYTTPGAWEKITFDPATHGIEGTPIDNFYTRMVIIFDDADKDIGEEWYFDELMGPGLTPIYYISPVFQVVADDDAVTTVEIDINNSGTMTALYNDGTHGDVAAGDSLWAITLENLPVGDHVWDVAINGTSEADDAAFNLPASMWPVTIEFTYDANVSSREPKSSSFAVYPNPASDQVTISMKSGLLKGVTVYNIQGSELKRINSIRTAEYNLNISELGAGMYFVKVDSDNGSSEVVKILKK
jgi:hypothetical protein